MTDALRPEPNNRPEWSYTEVEEALPAFVLGALTTNEMVVIERYLAQYPALRQQADRLQLGAVDMLAYAPSPTLPPPAVTDAILTRAQAAAAARPAAPGATAALPVYRAAPAPLPPRPGFWSRTTAWWRLNFAPAVVGVGMAALLVFLGAYFAQQRGLITALQGQIAALEATNAELQTSNSELLQINESLWGQLREQDLQLASLVRADTVVALAGTESAPEASGLVLLAADEATIVAANLPALGEDETYQLWLIPPDEQPVSAGLLAAQPAAPASWTTIIPVRPAEIAAVGISIEPAGGSAAPTNVVLLGST